MIPACWFLAAVTLFGSASLPIARAMVEESFEISTSLPWQCTVSASVRSPDLYPNAALPGEARLKMNGSECEQVEIWELGLRLKERAIVRFKAKGATFPPRFTEDERQEAQWWSEQQDIYLLGHGGSCSRQSPGDKEHEKYAEQLRNESLWDVHGVEREVFDVRTTLGSVAENESFAQLSVKPFVIHVPNTNFPPMRRGYYSGHDGFDIVGDEAVFEYYFIITRKNEKNPVYYPAGNVAFLPVEGGAVNYASHQMSGTKVSQLESPRYTPDEQRRHFLGEAPECDAGSFAYFTVSFNDLPSRITQGQDVYPLNVTITSAGNGSEYPSYISVHPDMLVYPTWAGSKAISHQQAAAIQPQPDIWPGGNSRGHLLRSHPHFRGPKDRNYRSGPFEKASGGAELKRIEVQNAIVYLNITNTTIPSFTTTFTDILPIIRIKLHTKFQCNDFTFSSTDLSVDLDQEVNWFGSGYHSRSRYLLDDSSRTDGLTHMGYVHFNVEMPSHPTAPPPVHYTSPAALAPSLTAGTISSNTKVTYMTVNSGWKEETERFELRGTRYDHWVRFGRWTMEGMQLSGSLWEEKLMREKEFQDLYDLNHPTNPTEKVFAVPAPV